MERRILHVSNSPYSSLADAGPSLAIFQELAQGAAAHHVLAPATGRPRRDRLGNLHLHTLPGRSARTFAATSVALAPLARRHRVNGILCQDPVSGGLAATTLGRALGIPVMVEVHTDIYFEWLSSPRRAQRLVARLAVRALRSASVVRTSGPALTATLAKLGVPQERTRLVPYRVDAEFFSPPARRERGGPLTAVSVGRFVPQKGYLELLDAVAAARDELERPLRVVLAGGGPLEQPLAERIAELSLESVVELRGWISRDEQHALLASADVYLQPSVPGYGEWMPRTILEAMATGLPTIATDVGGIADIVEDRRSGRLVPPGSAEAITAALLELGRDDDARLRLGTFALDRARSSFAWDVSFARYRDTLDELVELGT